MTPLDLDLTRYGSAVVDGEYRYSLTRQWSQGPRVCWIGLNPSTADAVVDDPTLRRLRTFSQREGFGLLVLVNLFARRCTRPVHLKDPGDPVGPDNDRAISEALSGSLRAIAAWGAYPGAAERARTVADLAEKAGLNLWCLGTTKDGAPRHPLYVQGDARLVRWTP